MNPWLFACITSIFLYSVDYFFHALRSIFKWTEISSQNWDISGSFLSFLFFSLSLSLSFFLEAKPEAYGGFQARDGIRATAASLRHNHNNTESEPYLWPTPQLTRCQILILLSKARDWTHILMDVSQVCYHWAMMGTPNFCFRLPLCHILFTHLCKNIEESLIFFSLWTIYLRTEYLCC